MVEEKKYILDPFNTICKLALVYFYGDNTKLSVGYNTINIQMYDYLQWSKRMKNGDTRHDISMLVVPIIKALQWYIIDSPLKLTLPKDVFENIKIIMHFSINGLYKLQQTTYCEDLGIKIIMQYLINLMKDSLNNNMIVDNLFDLYAKDNDNYKGIKNLLDNKIVNNVAHMLINCKESLPNQKNADILIECINKILINLDKQFISRIENTCF